MCCGILGPTCLLSHVPWCTQIAWYAALPHVGDGVPAMTGAGAAAPAPTGVEGAPHLPHAVVPAAPPPAVAAALLLSDALTGKHQIGSVQATVSKPHPGLADDLRQQMPLAAHPSADFCPL